MDGLVAQFFLMAAAGYLLVAAVVVGITWWVMREEQKKWWVVGSAAAIFIFIPVQMFILGPAQREREDEQYQASIRKECLSKKFSAPSEPLVPSSAIFLDESLLRLQDPRNVTLQRVLAYMVTHKLTEFETQTNYDWASRVAENGIPKALPVTNFSIQRDGHPNCKWFKNWIAEDVRSNLLPLRRMGLSQESCIAMSTGPFPTAKVQIHYSSKPLKEITDGSSRVRLGSYHFVAGLRYSKDGPDVAMLSGLYSTGYEGYRRLECGQKEQLESLLRLPPILKDERILDMRSISNEPFTSPPATFGPIRQGQLEAYQWTKLRPFSGLADLLVKDGSAWVENTFETVRESPTMSRGVRHYNLWTIDENTMYQTPKLPIDQLLGMGAAKETVALVDKDMRLYVFSRKARLERVYKLSEEQFRSLGVVKE